MKEGQATPAFGFAIDHRKCIGCHACTVACKAENEVPLGKFRTWVKYVDRGRFPAVRRHFTVLRCNHCDAAPCVEICPVNALQKRPDAIVDLDRDACIGCRACMQACPYDALYLNEDTGVAEKCHYCAHRTELGLEPACVIVCPEQAIVSGDTKDPESPISKLIREEKTSQRKLEKGTKPRVWYVDALPESIQPEATQQPASYLWSDRRVQPPPVPPELQAPDHVLTTLNADHTPEWGWHIWSYLMTKNLAAGAMMIAPFLAWIGIAPGFGADAVPEIVALVFLGITLFLLIHDLGRPERFLKILLTPNPRSWLVKGGWVLTAFGGLTAAALAARLAGADGAADLLRWINWPVAVLTSGYTAFLFWQCRGRDLWLSRTLFVDLVVRAAAMGAGFAMLLPTDPATGLLTDLPRALFALFTMLAMALIVFETWAIPETDHARRAHALLASTYDQGSLSLFLLGIGVAFAGLGSFMQVSVTETAALAMAFAAVLTGLYVRERAWIRAGQAVPNS